MKTILVAFVGENTSVAEVNNKKIKKYCFNTEDTLEVGDRIASNSYTGNMLVTDVLNTSYTYYNNNDGSLSNEITSTQCFPIKTLVLREDCPEVIYVHKI